MNQSIEREQDSDENGGAIEPPESAAALAGSPPKPPSVAIRPDHDVLVAKILVHSLIDLASIDTMHREIQSRLGDVHNGLVVDCSRLDRVSAEFLLHLTELRKYCDRQGLRFAICGLHGALADAFEISHLEAIVAVFPTQRDAVAALGKFSALERVGMECIAEEQAKQRAERPQTWSSSRLALPLATFAVALACTFFGWRTWQWGSQDQGHMSQSIWRLASPGVLEGDVRISNGAEEAPDSRCAVIAWPVDLVHMRKSMINRATLFDGDETSKHSTMTGPFLGHTDVHGNYRLLVRSPEYTMTDYYVLFISQNGLSSRPLSEDDRLVLNRYFADVDSLTGDTRCKLERCQVSAGATTRSNCRF